MVWLKCIGYKNVFWDNFCSCQFSPKIKTAEKDETAKRSKGVLTGRALLMDVSVLVCVSVRE